MSSVDLQKEYIYREITILAWGASVQGARLYSPSPPEVSKSEAFRKEVLNFIRSELLPFYETQCSEVVHLENVQKLADFGTSIGAELLGPDGYKIGVAQKLLNLLLKYLWCLGHIPEPPHCPVDRIVISKTKLRDKLNWTQIRSIAEYSKAISAIRTEAITAKRSIARWELEFYIRR